MRQGWISENPKKKCRPISFGNGSADNQSDCVNRGRHVVGGTRFGGGQMALEGSRELHSKLVGGSLAVT